MPTLDISALLIQARDTYQKVEKLNAFMQAFADASVIDLPQNTILGRITASTGAVEELTATQARTILNVEDGADVTDATNVDAAGAVMNSDTSTAAMSFVIDEDDFSSDSATKVPTQQSTRAYVLAQITALIDSSPGALDTLNELAAALGDDANFAATTATSLANRLRIDTAAQGLTGTEKTNALANLGVTATPAEMNYVAGVTSAIQTQLDAITAQAMENNLFYWLGV